MSKCPICNSRKGKRQCLISEQPICSLCCGITRQAETCAECGYYQPPKRDYSEVPAYAVAEMDGNFELESYGNAIEGALVAYDFDAGSRLRDSDAIRIIELLMDKYHFSSGLSRDESELIANGARYVDQVIGDDLKAINHEVITKVLGVIRFVARRRTKTGREYMAVIHEYVGQRITTGSRILRR